MMFFFVAAATFSQSETVRTLVNEENAPFVYLVLAGARAGEIETREAALELLRTNRRRLETVAPTGMWRIGSGVQTLVGYYAGGETTLGYRLMIKETSRGESPVYVSRVDLIHSTGGETVGIAPWELPERGEPVLLDGDAIEWREVDPLLQFSRYFEPLRVEDGSTGSEVDIDDSLLWRRGGTMVRSVRSVVGARYWYLELETETAIANGTGYLFRVFSSRDEAAPSAEVVALIDGTSGPVVVRNGDGSITLAGEYTQNDRTIEIAVLRTVLESVAENLFASDASFDVATTRRMETRSERFTLGTVYFREIPR